MSIIDLKVQLGNAYVDAEIKKPGGGMRKIKNLMKESGQWEYWGRHHQREQILKSIQDYVENRYPVISLPI